MRWLLISVRLPMVLIFAAFWVSPVSGAEPIGRFFHTPEERAILDNLRIAMAQGAHLDVPPPPPVPEENEAARVEEETIDIPESFVSFQGVVLRSSGRQTIWLNHRAYHENDIPAGVKPPEWTARDRMGIDLTHNGGVLTLKPGETALIEYGEPPGDAEK